MDFNAIIKRVIAIITKPKDEWQVIKKENLTISDMFLKYAIYLAAIAAIAGFIGYAVIGVSVGFGTFRMPAGRALMWSIFQYIFSLGGVFLIAFIIDSLAPSFGAKKNMVDSTKVVVYSYTASWVAGIFFIIPSIAGILGALLSLYTLYLLYLGIETIKEAPKEKAMGYFVVSLLVTIVVYVIIGLIVSNIVFGTSAAFMR